MRWSKPKLIAACLGCAIAAASSVAYQKTKTSSVPKVEMVAAVAPAAIQALEKRLQGSMMFVDPVTGQMRAPEPGEHSSLTGAPAAARIAPAVAPQAVAGPNGMYSISPESARIEFLTAVRNADGTMSYRCGNPAHKHPKGENHAR